MRTLPAVLACVAVLAVALVAVSAPARAQDGLRGALQGRGADGRKPAYPAVGRYVAAQGDGFTLDRSGGTALLKFDDDPEVWALKPTHGPRGDVIYRNDVGEPMVRTTRLGGLILFTDERPTGSPVAFTTEAGRLKIRSLSPGALLQHLAQASQRASRAVKRLVPFEAPEVTPGAEPLIADAAHLAAEGIVRVATSPERARLARLKRVRITEGLAAGAVVAGPTLEVVVSPRRGVSGRPSSARTSLAVVEAR